MRRTADDAAVTRARVLDAALMAFAYQGWDGATLDAIAKNAGLTRGAVYHHFRDKTVLLGAVLREEWAAQTAPAFSRLSVEGVSPEQRLSSFLGTYLRLLAEDRRFRALAIVTVLVAPQSPAGDDGLADKRAALDFWQTELALVLDHSVVPPPVMSTEHSIFVLMSFLYGATVTAAANPSQLPAAGSVDAIARAVVRGLFHKE